MVLLATVLTLAHVGVGLNFWEGHSSKQGKWGAMWNPRFPLKGSFKGDIDIDVDVD